MRRETTTQPKFLARRKSILTIKQKQSKMSEIKTIVTAERYHDFSAGHRVYGHESVCGHQHGHNYRVTFTCQADALDHVGRVIDFSVIKSKLCMWLEDNWDHRMLLWEEDPWCKPMKDIDSTVVSLPFNPTAENIGLYLLEVVGPRQLAGTGVTLTKVIVEETRKCSATVSLSPTQSVKIDASEFDDPIVNL